MLPVFGCYFLALNWCYTLSGAPLSCIRKWWKKEWQGLCPCIPRGGTSVPHPLIEGMGRGTRFAMSFNDFCSFLIWN